MATSDLEPLHRRPYVVPSLSYLTTIGHVEYDPSNSVSLVELFGNAFDFLEGSNVVDQ